MRAGSGSTLSLSCFRRIWCRINPVQSLFLFPSVFSLLFGVPLRDIYTHSSVGVLGTQRSLSRLSKKWKHIARKANVKGDFRKSAAFADPAEDSEMRCFGFWVIDGRQDCRKKLMQMRLDFWSHLGGVVFKIHMVSCSFRTGKMTTTPHTPGSVALAGYWKVFRCPTGASKQRFHQNNCLLLLCFHIVLFVVWNGAAVISQLTNYSNKWLTAGKVAVLSLSYRLCLWLLYHSRLGRFFAFIFIGQCRETGKQGEKHAQGFPGQEWIR